VKRIYLHCTESFSVLDMFQDETLYNLTYLLTFFFTYLLTYLLHCIFAVQLH